MEPRESEGDLEEIHGQKRASNGRVVVEVVVDVVVVDVVIDVVIDVVVDVIVDVSRRRG